MRFLCFQKKIYFWTSNRVSEMQILKNYENLKRFTILDICWVKEDIIRIMNQRLFFFFQMFKNNLIFFLKSKRRNKKSVTIQKDTATDIQTQENRDFVIVQKENERIIGIDSNN